MGCLRALIAIAALLLVSWNAAAAQVCLGDCNADSAVSVDEVVLGVNIVLEAVPYTACVALDRGTDALIDVSNVLEAITNLMEGCSPVQEQAAALATNRSKWLSQGITSYQMRYNRSCFCRTPSSVDITVRNGLLISIRDAKNGEDVEPELGAFGYNTIESLFEIIADAIERRAASLDVEYNAERGFPTRVSIDYQRGLADDEISISVDQFERLED